MRAGSDRPRRPEHGEVDVVGLPGHPTPFDAEDDPFGAAEGSPLERARDVRVHEHPAVLSEDPRRVHADAGEVPDEPLRVREDLARWTAKGLSPYTHIHTRWRRKRSTSRRAPTPGCTPSSGRERASAAWSTVWRGNSPSSSSWASW